MDGWRQYGYEWMNEKMMVNGKHGNGLWMLGDGLNMNG